jgi:cytidyltransferase-like protein
MNIGEQIARELLEQSTPIVALYPGKFKPPHAGHFDVANKASTIADEVIVIMSNVPKDEFTAEQSMKVWSLYKDLLPSNVEIKVATKSSPVSEVFDIIKDKSRDFIVLYGKGERSRYASIERDREKYSNVQIVDAGTFESLNATDLRTAIRNKDLEDIQKFLPKGIDAKKIFSIYSQDEFKPGPMVHELKSEYIQNFIKEDIEAWGMLPEYKVDLEDTYGYKDEGGFFTFYDDVNGVDIIVKLKKLPSDTTEFKFYPMKDGKLLGFIKLEKSNPKIMNTIFTIFKDEVLPYHSKILIQPAGYTRYRLFRAMVNSYLDKNQYDIKLKDDIESPLILISKKQPLNEAFTRDKAPIIQKLVTFACEQLQIEQPPIKLINSPTYTQEHSSFGGYYPSEQKIVCVVHNRNMADILRTLAHELVHHMQNGKGELDSKAGEDGSPSENEANSTAGLIMRKFGRENPQIFESELNEAIVGDKIECDNCGWSWDIEDGGDDLFICHKCGHDNIDEYDVENEQDLKEFVSFLKEYQQQLSEGELNEAEYQGRKVTLGKPMQGDIKKFKVYVKNNKGKVVKVNFGFGGSSAKGKRMVIKAKNPKRRAAYRARHNCDNPGPRWKANYWSCKKW